ncbi:MAG: YfhO family protein [Lachnospiraceae bacterium]|nr:YfhO family protein [Lachnospiraceae bacterium]
MKRMKKNKYALAAFFGPLLLMTGIMIALECAPFGNQSFMIVDALHQYLPFFSDYQEKLKDMDSLFYSWNGGLGYNFYSLWAYYLSSPFNLVIAAVSKHTMISVLNWLISIKFALCSFTGFFYFSHREGKQSLRNIAFGLCYAFSSYMTGYYWNIMWLEVMILLPIILIGMDHMMDYGKSRIYCLALFASMFCNYYMSFMVCIFLALWYFTYYFDGVKDFVQKGIRFAWNSLLAAAMAAVVLIPAYLGLMSTSSATLNFPKWEFYGKAAELFATHMAAVEPYNMSTDDGLGNLYCGILPLLVFILLLIDKKIPRKEKLRKVLILVFMAVSFQVEILNYVWHGFHNQYGIPNRFAFLYIFLILIMAHDQLLYMDYLETKRWKIALAAAVLIAGVVYCYQKSILDQNESYVISGGLVILYGLLLCIRKKRAMVLIYICMIAEVMANAVYGFYESGQIDADYFFGDTKAVQQITEKEKPTIETRMELLHSKMLDESIWYAMPNVTMFGSTALGDTVNAMDQLGFYTGVNEYLYEGATPITDMLLGVKSILLRDMEIIDRTGYEYYYAKDRVQLYKNNLPASIGYWMDQEAQEWNYQSLNPFDVQNDLMEKAYHISELFEKISVDMPVAYGCTVEDQGNGNYDVENDDTRNHYVTFVFNVEENTDMYLHFDFGGAENAELFVNGESRQSGRLNSQIISVGKVSEGDVVSLKIELEPEEEGNGIITMRAASLDNEKFKQLVSTMKKNSFEMESYTSTSIFGHLNAKEDGVIFFSIPYDQGWKVMIDGKAEEVQPMEEGFLSIPVKKGKHDISLEYRSPGFSAGWKISAAAWSVFVLLWILEECKKRFRNNSFLE